MGPESIRVVRPKLYQRGTRVPYAVFHQEGYTVSKWGRVRFRIPRRVPARQIIPDPLPSEFRATLGRIILHHVMRGGGAE